MFHGTITEELTSHKEWSHYNENIREDQKDFVFVKFSGLYLKSMENLQPCVSLKVCIFSNNFITDIHPLQNCIKLIKLDLHGNQIKNLPDTKFWKGLKNLKLLYLHDNAFAKLKNICILSACPSLIALTLFDCPVSLKKGYRHVLVNSIWPLKALDHHVISDEEIIENWHLPERFKTYNQRLFFNFYAALRKGATYDDELNNIKDVISRINKILAHNSPVLIIQRWIRGFLVRKKLSPFFMCKRYREKIFREYEAKWIYITKGSEDGFLKDIIFKDESNIRGKLTHWKHNIYPLDFKKASGQRKNVSSILYGLKTKDIGRKSKKSRHLFQKGQKESGDENEDEELDTSFRISAFKLPIYTPGSLKYAAVLKEKKQDYFPVHAHLFSTSHPKPIIKKGTLSATNIRQFFTTQRTGIKLETLNDIDKYYAEQKKQDSHEEKIRAVSKARADQKRVGLIVRESINKKKNTTKKLIERDHDTIQKDLQQLWQDRLSYLIKVRERSTLFLEEKNQKAEEHLLIQTLSNERTLLTKGIIKIDRLKRKEALLKQKYLNVQKKREEEKYQRNLLNQMKEYRAQEIHKKHCAEKFVMDMINFQKAVERYQDAKSKVALVKTNFVFNVPSGMMK
ncbi:leucine-rich repeat and IQ domain-containing protein 3 [Sciurus carolinensis]|uniref:leucine-rich repeat and IQ domain-containing protein 3 n=1 Tax=Sciurus carolinensis TaxID=30640 RepID=UPI001FB30F59|nr:leucine-rich repeat and IQ domain-containing protein 3 [Sciurus carolinensis]